MKDEDIKALAQAANDLLECIDNEALAIDLKESSLSLGTVRQLLLNVEVALWPFEHLIDVEEELATMPEGATKQ